MAPRTDFLRRRKRIGSQAKFAREAGVSLKTIQRFEKGLDVDPSNAALINDALHRFDAGDVAVSQKSHTPMPLARLAELVAEQAKAHSLSLGQMLDAIRATVVIPPTIESRIESRTASTGGAFPDELEDALKKKPTPRRKP